MIYPYNFEDKIGFTEIRSLLRSKCLSSLGMEKVGLMTFTDKMTDIKEKMQQTREFNELMTIVDDFPLTYFFDIRDAIKRIRVEGSYLDIGELFDLQRSLDTIQNMVLYLNKTDDEANEETETQVTYLYPALHRLAENVCVFPQFIRRINDIIDKYGQIKDNASPELLKIRRELSSTENSISRNLNAILRKAQSNGMVEKDVAPTLRDGRLVIPINPALKKKIKGIIHDESATGKTVFIEPTEVVEANNRIRELESEERREIIHILNDFSTTLRPHIQEILFSYELMAQVDFINAKSELSKMTHAVVPNIQDCPMIDWTMAAHPLLLLSLAKHNKKVIPLDITLASENRILIISGPNAGGKSVCLKTVGLLQYMLQCGLPVPMGEASNAGIFKSIFIDIGDEQSIENDLSTYSGHLLNMKNILKKCDDSSLLLIDEFGSGTEPAIGGALAEALLKRYNENKAYGIITTHYQNLKHFAEAHEGIINGAMLYDRHLMQPLFQLQIGNPGSSFAIEIARKTGIPDDVIEDASEIVGSDYIQSDKYLQDIVRDKRYWENKRVNIHQREKKLEQTLAKYESEIADLQQSRKEIISKAKEEAGKLLKDSNALIEQVIREIREAQAQKEKTRDIRKTLDKFREDVEAVDKKAEEDKIARRIEQIKERKRRKEERKPEKLQSKKNANKAPALKDADALQPGDTVRIKGQNTVGSLEKVNGNNSIVIFNMMRTSIKTALLERTTAPERENTHAASYLSKETRDQVYEKKLEFRPEIDVRGMRGNEALNVVKYFIDDAILLNMSPIRILHGTGTGILRQLIRDYLSGIAGVASYHDEHVQLGGSGITVVELS